MGKIIIEKETKYDIGDIVIFLNTHEVSRSIGIIKSYEYDLEQNCVKYMVNGKSLTAIKDDQQNIKPLSSNTVLVIIDEVNISCKIDEDILVAFRSLISPVA